MFSLKQAEQMMPKLEGKFDVSLYTSAVYIIIVVAAIVSIVAFFGCFGAVKVKTNCIFIIIKYVHLCANKNFLSAFLYCFFTTMIGEQMPVGHLLRYHPGNVHPDGGWSCSWFKRFFF